MRETNIQTIGCWGEEGVGGTAPTVRLEFSEPSGTYAIPDADACDELSFDASNDPVRIQCDDEIRPLYRLGSTQSVLGEPGDFRPFYEVADRLVEKRGQPVLRGLLTEAHDRDKMPETLVALSDTDCGAYWQVSYEGLDVAAQKSVIHDMREKRGESELREERIRKNE